MAKTTFGTEDVVAVLPFFVIVVEFIGDKMEMLYVFLPGWFLTFFNLVEFELFLLLLLQIVLHSSDPHMVQPIKKVTAPLKSFLGLGTNKPLGKTNQKGLFSQGTFLKTHFHSQPDQL